ncbi:MAG: ABC transporter permease [Flavobacteriales bacterium]|nr:ABC transporter permease [Flavobacteriales bacterium]
MKNNNNNKGNSLVFDAWIKLKANRSAMAGLFVILIAVIISILGANIRPDSSVDANHQIQQIARLNPGSSVKHLKVRRNEQVETVSFFGKLFFGGQSNPFKYIPINDFVFEDEFIVFEEYKIESSSELPLYRSIPIADVLYPLSIDKEKSFKILNDGTVSVLLFNNETITASISSIQKEIQQFNIVEKTYLLGTDKQGRDMLSRLMAGTIVSLSVGLIAVLISLIIGLFFGAIAGYFRGWIDDLIMWFINLVWSIPGLLLVISLTLIIGKGFTTIFFAVGLTMWVELARIVRGQILSIREKEFIIASRALGYSNFRIIWRHIFPNILGPVIVICASNFAAAILIEAGLSFLGIGVQIPMPSWGFMIEQHKGLIMDADKAYLALLPGLAIIILVFAFMTLGNGLRDALDNRDDSLVEQDKLKGAPIE